MKLTVEISDANNPKRAWTETWTTDRETDPQEYAEGVVDKFNATLKTGETERALVRIVEVDAGYKEHRWRKTNLVTLPDGSDNFQCADCGITANGYAMAGGIIRDKAYQAKVYELCHTAQEHLEKRRRQ